MRERRTGENAVLLFLFLEKLFLNYYFIAWQAIFILGFILIFLFLYKISLNFNVIRRYEEVDRKIDSPEAL